MLDAPDTSSAMRNSVEVLDQALGPRPSALEILRTSASIIGGRDGPLWVTEDHSGATR